MAVSTLLSIVPSHTGHDLLCAMMDLSNPPQNYEFTRIVFFRNDKEVARFELGTAVSINPTLGIHLSDLAPGEVLAATWYDTGGRTGTAKTVYQGDSQ